MPKAITPWKKGAYVGGEALSEEDAVEMIVIAMEKSKGWSA
jgi:hypothetical protein